ncbi:MAG: hypothetical protein ACRERD_24035, partial [Candidatus Binatia bacterium]
YLDLSVSVGGRRMLYEEASADTRSSFLGWRKLLWGRDLWSSVEPKYRMALVKVTLHLTLYSSLSISPSCIAIHER